MKTRNIHNALFYAGLIYLLLFAIIGTAKGQTFKLEETAHEIVVKETPYQLTIEGTTFEAFLTKNGQNYIWRTSRNGHAYKMYLGYDYGSTFEGAPIYTNKEGTEFWILKLTQTNYPKKVKLLKE